MENCGNPKFVEMNVWKRVQFYSCTRKALTYVESSYDRSIGLREIAAVVGMEATAFSKAFKRKTGMTLHGFIQAYRISQAAMAMEVSDYSVTEIAFRVGFNGLDVFDRTFKKIVGTTPSKYRLEILRNNSLITDAPRRVHS